MSICRKIESVPMTDLVFSFEVEEFRRHCLLNGLDDIGLTMQTQGRIRQYEETHPVAIPR